MQHAGIWTEQTTVSGVPEEAVHHCQPENRSVPTADTPTGHFLQTIHRSRNVECIMFMFFAEQIAMLKENIEKWGDQAMK